MPRTKPHSETKIAEAALKLAGRQGWQSLTLDQIAKAAKIPPAQMRNTVREKSAILPAIMCLLDAQTLTKAGKTDPHATPHDRLFEILMARFDVLQERRAGILVLFEACRADPALARSILPAHWQMAQNIFAHARLVPEGRLKPLATFGLLAVYYRALWRWQKDQTPDMAKTMAALDQALRCAAGVAEILFRNK